MDPANAQNIKLVNSDEKRKEIRHKATMLAPSKHKKLGKPTVKDLLSFIGTASFMAHITRGARRYINALTTAIPYFALVGKDLHSRCFDLHRQARKLVWKIVNMLDTSYAFSVQMRPDTYRIYTDASGYSAGVSDGRSKHATFGFHGKVWEKHGLNDVRNT